MRFQAAIDCFCPIALCHVVMGVSMCGVSFISIFVLFVWRYNDFIYSSLQSLPWSPDRSYRKWIEWDTVCESNWGKSRRIKKKTNKRAGSRQPMLNKADLDFILWLGNEKHAVIVIFDNIFRCSSFGGGSQNNSIGYWMAQQIDLAEQKKK